MAEPSRGFNQEHLTVNLWEAWTWPPIGQPDFILRRREGLGKYLPVHKTEVKDCRVGYVSAHGGL